MSQNRHKIQDHIFPFACENSVASCTADVSTCVYWKLMCEHRSVGRRRPTAGHLQASVVFTQVNQALHSRIYMCAYVVSTSVDLRDVIPALGDTLRHSGEVSNGWGLPCSAAPSFLLLGQLIHLPLPPLQDLHPLEIVARSLLGPELVHVPEEAVPARGTKRYVHW